MGVLAKIWSARARPDLPAAGTSAKRGIVDCGRRTRLMLVDDNSLLCGAMRSWLTGEPGIEWVGEATESETARAEVRVRRPDVVLLDINFPECSGFELLEGFLQDRPGMRVIMLSGTASRELVEEGLRRGAAGYITKLTPVAQIGELIRRAARGEMVLCPESQAAAAGRLAGL